jgi:hypothetical protein
MVKTQKWDIHSIISKFATIFPFCHCHLKKDEKIPFHNEKHNFKSKLILQDLSGIQTNPSFIHFYFQKKYYYFEINVVKVQKVDNIFF